MWPSKRYGNTCCMMSLMCKSGVIIKWWTLKDCRITTSTKRGGLWCQLFIKFNTQADGPVQSSTTLFPMSHFNDAPFTLLIYMVFYTGAYTYCTLRHTRNHMIQLTLLSLRIGSIALFNNWLLHMYIDVTINWVWIPLVPQSLPVI